MRIFLPVFIAAVTVPHAFAQQQQPEAPSSAVFLRLAGEHWSSLEPPASILGNALAGDTLFLPIASLTRGQDEISVDNILAKLEERIAAGDVIWNAKSARWQFAHDQGRSSVPLSDPIQVVKGPQGWVIADGHHDFFLSLYLGAETIGVVVKDDLSSKSPLEFWRELELRRLTRLGQKPETLASKPPQTPDVKDNPNRYLAALLALKASVNGTGEKLEIKAIKGPKEPVWIKINDSIPFIEFYIAQALSDADIHYDSSWAKDVPAQVRESARRALLNAQAAGKIPELAKIPVLPTSAQATELRAQPTALKSSLQSFLRSRCAQIFAPKS